MQLKHLIINLDPDDEGNEDAVTPKVSKSIPSTPSNHVGSTPTQIPNTPNHNDVSNVSYESPEYQKQVITTLIQYFNSQYTSKVSSKWQYLGNL